MESPGAIKKCFDIRFQTGDQYTVVLGSLPVFASIFPTTAISAGFPLPLCRQRSPWPAAGYFANNGSLKKRFRFAMFLSMRGFIRCMFADSFAMPLLGRVISGIGGFVSVSVPAFLGKNFERKNRTAIDFRPTPQGHSPDRLLETSSFIYSAGRAILLFRF